ncbi:MAG: 50S ribosomal protein L11 methyltransferase [Planctomycetota bacterium]|jgi:protein arginine N-methyltransferase 1
MSDTTHAILGYDHYYHMLSDSVRMDAYRRAVIATVQQGDVVVDLGAGLGVLGLWALKAGAAKVYAIEKTNAVQLAQEIAEANGLADKIEFIQQNSLDVELPEKADLLVSETLGSFAIDENTLPFTFDARDRFLADDGAMIPGRLDLYAAPIEAPNVYDKIDFWRHIPDIDFKTAFDLFSSKIMIEPLALEQLMATAAPVASIDLTTETDPTFHKQAFFAMRQGGTVHGVTGWFTAHLTPDIAISTAPDQPQTHWKQAVFPFRDPVNVIKGDVLDWSVQVTPREPGSDETRLSYRYRCTQLANEPGAVDGARRKIHNAPCPCGSGRKFCECCLR